MNKPRILFFDVETAPLECYTWGIRDQHIPVEMIKTDWSLISIAAKWHGTKEMIYSDNRAQHDPRDDRRLIKLLHGLLDEADIVVTQNGNSFDIKKFNARAVILKMKPPSMYKQVDTCRIAQIKFGFTSNKLSYLTEKLCPQFKKLKHEEYPGFDMWRAVLEKDKKVWDVMEKYNKHDVLGLEAVHNVIQPWAFGSNSINPNLYTDGVSFECYCGNKHYESKGFAYTAKGKYRRFRCTECGKEVRETKNLFTKEKTASLRVKV